MPLPRAPLLLLGAVLGSFTPRGFCDSPAHSLSYFYLHLPEPSQSLPKFSIKSYLDDQPIARYDSLTRKMEPLVSWMEEMDKEAFLSPEWVFRTDPKLSKWDHRAREPPVGEVTRKVVDVSLEVLICQAFGFYPKEIQANWTRDGEIWEHKTLHRNVAPNSDRTYYHWLGIEIDPKERDHFRCHLEHEGLQEPLILAFKQKETGFDWKTLVGIVFGVMFVVVILGVVIFFLICRWKRSRNNVYEEVAPCHDPTPSQSVPSSPVHDTDDETQSLLSPQTSGASYGLQSTRSFPGAIASPRCSQEGMGHSKSKTWDGCITKSLQATAKRRPALDLNYESPPEHQ